MDSTVPNLTNQTNKVIDHLTVDCEIKTSNKTTVPIWPNLFNYKIGNAKHTVLRVGAMTGWLGVQIMCWSGMAYLHVD